MKVCTLCLAGTKKPGCSPGRSLLLNDLKIIVIIADTTLETGRDFTILAFLSPQGVTLAANITMDGYLDAMAPQKSSPRCLVCLFDDRVSTLQAGNSGHERKYWVNVMTAVS